MLLIFSAAKPVFFFETLVSSGFNFSRITTAHGLKEVSHGPCTVLPVQSVFVAVDLYCPEHFMMYKLTRLMAQEKPPFL